MPALLLSKKGPLGLMEPAKDDPHLKLSPSLHLVSWCMYASLTGKATEVICFKNKNKKKILERGNPHAGRQSCNSHRQICVRRSGAPTRRVCVLRQAGGDKLGRQPDPAITTLISHPEETAERG